MFLNRLNKIDVRKRTYYFSLGFSVLIGMLGMPIATSDIDFGYWFILFILALHIELIYSYFFRLDMRPPFSPILKAGNKKDKRWRLSAVLFAVALIIPLLSHWLIKDYFGGFA